MPKIELEVGEAVVVTFAGTDGEITVAFCDREVRILTGCRPGVAATCLERGGIVVHADLGDRAGHEGVIYHESCDVLDDEGLKREVGHGG